MPVSFQEPLETLVFIMFSRAAQQEFGAYLVLVPPLSHCCCIPYLFLSKFKVALRQRRSRSRVRWFLPPQLVQESSLATVFEPGDFVRLITSPAGRVGVVSCINPEGAASVQVCWRRGSFFSVPDVFEPHHLLLVPSEGAPEYAVTLKRSLGLFCRKV